MPIRVLLPLCALLLAACATQTATRDQQAADRCRLYKTWMVTQEPEYVKEVCTRQLGAAGCRACLGQ